MSVTLAAVLITAAVSIGGSWLVARTTGRSAAAAVEVAARASDRARMQELERQVTELWALRRQDAVTIRRLGDFIDVLEAHIWQRKPPPPPARPTDI
ncbi:hypothetical protein CWIS_13535 [Cellulomonas sp. A375-1]|uniref:hypothetical protein n=1 Tax=Cellulomonas sp. A375-1 TaxID=1672219 RepID=UPI0006527A07|nr:hypothetical protein [Cellulomonas sp. A375-1]KMM44851.1 hypothetical protein CWIS_13535 [Cellulomonas sp. A375-1]